MQLDKLETKLKIEIKIKIKMNSEYKIRNGQLTNVDFLMFARVSPRKCNTCLCQRPVGALKHVTSQIQNIGRTYRGA